MNIHVRRILYVIFIGFFLVITPIVLFFTLGYKYNFEKSRIEKTGVFFIKSYPKNASIFLNDKEQKQETPAQINRLLANNYKVTVRIDGYHVWSKSLPIYPKSTTFIEDITLFKNALEPNVLLDGKFSNILPTSNFQKLALVNTSTSSSEIIYYNLIGKKSIPLTSSKNNLEISSWCNSNNKIIAKDKDDHLIINVESKTIDSIYSLTKFYFSEVKCDYYNDNIFYALRNEQLYQIDLIQRKITKLTKDTIVSFISWKSKLLYISVFQNKYVLKSLVNDESEEILVVPTSLDYDFIPSNQNYLAILDKDEDIAYIIEPESTQPYKSVIKHVSDLRWYDKQFIYWSDYELSAYYPESNETIFIERTSSTIQNAFWHSAFTYVFAQIDDQLKVYELDGRDSRNVHDILTLSEETHDNIFVNKKGDKLYLISEIDGQTGLFEVEIQ